MSNHGWPEESDSDVIQSLIRERDALAAELANAKATIKLLTAHVGKTEWDVLVERNKALEDWAGRAIFALHEAFNDTPGWCDTYRAVIAEYPTAVFPPQTKSVRK